MTTDYTAPKIQYYIKCNFVQVSAGVGGKFHRVLVMGKHRNEVGLPYLDPSPRLLQRHLGEVLLFGLQPWSNIEVGYPRLGRTLPIQRRRRYRHRYRVPGPSLKPRRRFNYRLGSYNHRSAGTSDTIYGIVPTPVLTGSPPASLKHIDLVTAYSRSARNFFGDVDALSEDWPIMFATDWRRFEKLHQLLVLAGPGAPPYTTDELPLPGARDKVAIGFGSPRVAGFRRRNGAIVLCKRSPKIAQSVQTNL